MSEYKNWRELSQDGIDPADLEEARREVQHALTLAELLPPRLTTTGRSRCT